MERYMSEPGWAISSTKDELMTLLRGQIQEKSAEATPMLLDEILTADEPTTAAGMASAVGILASLALGL